MILLCAQRRLAARSFAMLRSSLGIPQHLAASAKSREKLRETPHILWKIARMHVTRGQIRLRLALHRYKKRPRARGAQAQAERIS